MKPQRMSRAVCALVASACLASLGGCSVFGVDPTPRYIGTETLERIDRGSTTQDWVLAVFGQPSFKADLTDGQTQIWKYPYAYVERSHERMRLLTGHEGEGADRVVFVQVSGGVVTDWWRD